ncbi:MAG: enhanced intracellular survival protein Eis, partial [Candidatus Hodarchaeota archaeon]
MTDNVQELTMDNHITYNNLLRYAFTRESSYITDQKELWYPPEDYYEEGRVLGIFDGENLVSAITFEDYDLYIRGTLFKMGGLGGVATTPSHRNRGYIRNLLIACFEKMHQKEIPITVLYPFKSSFYENFGYRLADEQHVFQIETLFFKISPVEGYYIKEIFNYSEFVSIIKSVYEQIAQGARGYNYMVKRNEHNWKLRERNKGFNFVCYDKYNTPQGYLILKPIKDANVKVVEPLSTMEISEIFWLSAEAKQTLFNFIGAHKDQRKYALFSTAEPKLFSYLKEFYIKSHKVWANSMARIIDVPTVLSQIQYPSMNTQVVLRVIDEHCSRNNK